MSIWRFASLNSLRPNICVSKLNIIGSSLVRHYLTQCCNIVDFTLKNKLQWNSYIPIHENVFGNVVCEMSAILPRPQWVREDDGLSLNFTPDSGQWASYQIRKIAVCACAGNAGNVFPHRRFRRKPLVSDPGMHHGTCVTHVPWCMSGSLTCGGGENVPGIPGACASAILRIWQEAHCTLYDPNVSNIIVG